MKYAILSDLHANLDALERVLDDAARLGVEKIVCLGDVVGYGPLPAETLRRIRAAASLILAGNHDDAVSGRMDAADFIDLAGDAVSRHREALSRDEIQWLKNLPHTGEIEGAALSHGDLTSPADFLYIDSEDAAAANFAATDSPLVFVGHTHIPGIYLTGQSGRIYSLGAEDFVVEDGKRYIVNVGSVGYPRAAQGQCFSSYALYDSAEKSVRFRLLPFAVASVLQRGRNHRRHPVLVAVLGTILLSALIALACLTFNKPEPMKSDLVPPLQKRTIVLTSTDRTICPKMKLAPKSPKALLTISYFTADGKELTPVSQTAKSCQRKFEIPAGAVRATLAIRAASTNEVPVIREFAPFVE